MKIVFNQSDLPELLQTDGVVIGGGLGAVAAALALRKSGQSVSLIESRTYLGYEIATTLRPWLPNRVDLPPLLAGCLQASGRLGDKPEVPLHMDSFKLHLEDVLLNAGVKLIYASHVVGLHAPEGHIAGVIVGNKSGRQIITCRTLIDATPQLIAARLSLEPVEATSGVIRATRTLEFDSVSHVLENEYAFYTPHEIEGHSFIMHPGYRDRQVWVEALLELPAGELSAFAATQREIDARRSAMQLASLLMAQVSAFSSASLTGSSYEIFPATPLLRPSATRTDWAHGATAEFADHNGQRWTASQFARSLPGVWYLPGGDPIHVADLGDKLGHAIAGFSTTGTAGARSHDTPHTTPAEQDVLTQFVVREPAAPQRGRHYTRHPVANPPVMVMREVDVLVVGGGTSGASAAIAAAQEGAGTVLVEMNPGLGGTGTFGGVQSYWFGRRIAFSGRVVEWVAEMHRYLHQPEPKGALLRWNIEAKSYALLHQAESSGVEMLLNTSVIGVITEGDSVRGIIAATPYGPVAILARTLIDATGDGDVAAFAGAEFVYGSTRDHAVMWYSLAQFTRPGLTRNNFTSSVDVGNIEDYTRAILAGRRRGGKAEMHDHGIYVATRESRHIKGEIGLTLTDQLRKRAYPDVIGIAFSNHDIKGQTSSDWLRVGLIPPNLEIEIPYRALLPHNLENILIVGKAISADHDALPAVRMQPDLENLGGTAALAAVQAVREGVAPRQITLRVLQERLIIEGLLPPSIIDRHLAPRDYTPEEIQHWIAFVADDKPLHAYSDMELDEVYTGLVPIVELCCSGALALAATEVAFERATGNARINLARALALMGSDKGAAEIVTAVQAYIDQGTLPKRDNQIRHVNLPPDQNAMPDVVYLLYTLGLLRTPQALPVWAGVVDALASVTEEDFLDGLKGIFYYVDAVCFGAERLATPELIPLLRRLLNYQPFHNKYSYDGFQADYVQERQAYLEIVIARALARCGSPEGFVVLINYLNDSRALLAEHAHTELKSITGEQYGKSVADWSEWLESRGDQLVPVPWTQPSDAVVAWADQPLFEASVILNP